MKLNEPANQLCDLAVERLEALRLDVHHLACGSRIIDFGVNVQGGISAGLLLAKICLAGQANVELISADAGFGSSPQIQVSSDHPLQACMASQYAGWPVKVDKFFAMGSGPMRSKRGREPVLETFGFNDASLVAVGVLEVDQLPNDAICKNIAEECCIASERLTLCIAPTRSIAGTIQIVARSLETTLHKLFELGFDLQSVVSGYGQSPLPPPIPDFAKGIGRTNDAILYGGRVTLWVDTEDSQIEKYGPKVPSCSSKDWGRPFEEVFREYEFDFYKVDPGLFSPAEVTFNNLRTGRTSRFGSLRPDVLSRSFGTHS